MTVVSMRVLVVVVVVAAVAWDVVMVVRVTVVVLDWLSWLLYVCDVGCWGAVNMRGIAWYALVLRLSR